MQVETLPTAAAARDFYEGRYAHGYMDRWEAERAERLLGVLRQIELPKGARILDYGCGSGALTALLAQRWPDAEVHGADISSTAVGNARARHGSDRLRFAELNPDFVREQAGTFDFVFSHHVLEHVFDLPAAVGDLCKLLAAGGCMLHALPCGNPGSLAHWLCAQRPDGIDTGAGNRFYFEESSHLRRLRSDELAAVFAAHGLALRRASFGYHWFGALRLFTELAPGELFALFDPRRCRPSCLPLLLPLLVLCTLLAAARAPAQVLVRCRRLFQQVFTFRTRRLTESSSLCLLALAVPALCLLPVSALVEGAVRWADRREWRTARSDPRGSEMMLEFAREPAPLPPARRTQGAPKDRAAGRVVTAALAASGVVGTDPQA